jgi:hypothetical protein
VAQPLIDIARQNGDSLAYVHTDSWEMGLTNWTHDFGASFKRLRGYDIAPFMPVLTNRIVGSRDLSNRFLEDFRMTVSDLVAQENYQVLKDLAHANGLLLHSESGGPHAAPLEALQTLGINDIPMSEFWVRADTHELDVTNCWVNRLIGDSKLPKGQRRTQTNVAGEFEKPGAEKGLRLSGLLGPVRLQFAEIVPPRSPRQD